MNKFKGLRRENQQLRSLLRQNELIVNQNIEQLKHEKSLSLRLCQAILPLIKRFAKSDTAASEHPHKLSFETPKTPEELISLLEKIQNEAQSNDFFKKIFEQDPVASENRFLNETLQATQHRIVESEHRRELLQRLNENLADDLSLLIDELDSLKKTVIGSHSLLIPMANHGSGGKAAADSDSTELLIVPSYLRVMQAEQALIENFVYESEAELGGGNLGRRTLGSTRLKPLDESNEIDGENENSIP